MGSSDSVYKLISNINVLNKIQTKSPKLVGTCYCARRPGFYLYNALSLIFLITVSALTVFSINLKLPANRLQTTYTILLASISFKWVINRSLPPVSYLTSLDKYAIACIFYVCVLAAWHGLIGSYWPVLGEEYSRTLDKCILVFFFIVFIVIHLIGVVWLRFSTSKIRFLHKQEKQFVKQHVNSLKGKNAMSV